MPCTAPPAPLCTALPHSTLHHTPLNSSTPLCTTLPHSTVQLHFAPLYTTQYRSTLFYSALHHRSIGGRSRLVPLRKRPSASPSSYAWLENVRSRQLLHHGNLEKKYVSPRVTQLEEYHHLVSQRSRAETGSGYAGREGAAAAYSLTWKLPEKPRSAHRHSQLPPVE